MYPLILLAAVGLNLSAVELRIQPSLARTAGAALLFESSDVAVFEKQCASSPFGYNILEIVFKIEDARKDFSSNDQAFRTLFEETIYPLVRRRCPLDNPVAIAIYVADIHLDQSLNEHAQPLTQPTEVSLNDVLVTSGPSGFNYRPTSGYRSLADLRAHREQVAEARKAAAEAKAARDEKAAAASGQGRRGVHVSTSLLPGDRSAKAQSESFLSAVAQRSANTVIVLAFIDLHALPPTTDDRQAFAAFISAGGSAKMDQFTEPVEQHIVVVRTRSGTSVFGEQFERLFKSSSIAAGRSWPEPAVFFQSYFQGTVIDERAIYSGPSVKPISPENLFLSVIGWLDELGLVDEGSRLDLDDGEEAIDSQELIVDKQRKTVAKNGKGPNGATARFELSKQQAELTDLYVEQVELIDGLLRGTPPGLKGKHVLLERERAPLEEDKRRYLAEIARLDPARQFRNN